MKFVAVRELRVRPGKVWKALSKDQELLLTSKGKPFAVMLAVSEENFEESLAAIRRARGLAAVAAIQEASVRAGLDKLTLDEINAEINAARKARRR